MSADSLWLRTMAALLWGLVLSVSLMLNINYLLPLPTTIKLFVGLLLAFIIWAGVMTYCFSQSTAIKASLFCVKVFVVSAIINAAFILI
jgi:hypothetical protein